MTAVQVMFLLATLLCSLVAGLLLTFAIVVMPGIAKLDDGGFLRAFQAIDRVIQNNQPVFLFVWMGSALALIATAVMSVWELGGTDRSLAIGATLVYVFGVQLPTVTINVPLNNQLQKLKIDTMSEEAQKRARTEFEPRWNRWNVIRTACSIFVSVVLLLLLLRL